MTVTISFEPHSALNYSCTTYCNISCSEERLALHLAGEGIGPKAVLSQNDIDIGDVFVTSIHVIDFTIENRGEIEATFKLIVNDTPFGRMFKFDMESGTLGVGERLNFTVTFMSDILGEFSETFKFRLEGSTELLPLNFKGHVVAPTFRVEPEIIDFGRVSYSFPNHHIIKLINTSQVPFRFNLRIPGDGRVNQKEFEIKPSRDIIGKDEEREILISFTPQNVRKYDMVMVIDIENVGQDMLSLPIKGESFVPTVKIKPHDKLDFEDVFLRHQYTHVIELINESNLPAKFKILPQTEESKVLAQYSTDYETGEIPPGQPKRINIILITNRLGKVILPLSILIIGNSSLPYVVNIIANSMGPIVEITDREIDFGNIEVLKDWTRTTRILNKSLIPAQFHVFTKNRVSIFRPLQKQGLLGPEESMDIQIVCTADDANKFTDILHFVIKEGDDVDIVLKAKGIGSTIFCKEDLKLISFGIQYTFRNITREVFVENKGRKPQKLQWIKKKSIESKRKVTVDDDKKYSKRPNSAQSQPDSDDNPDIFAIVPETILLPAKTGIMFQFRCNSTLKGKISEQFSLTSTTGEERKQTELHKSTFEGEFINPSLLFSAPKLNFKYVWEKNVPFMHIAKNLEITCGSLLPVNFTLKVQTPFSISAENLSLIPGKSTTIVVHFDPGMKFDRLSGVTNSKLQIIHADHPHREYVDLAGETCFPNLKLEQNKINFGSILSDTTKRISVEVINTSEMVLNYEWTFIDELIQREALNAPGESQLVPYKKKASIRDFYKVNEIFDILPMNGTLNPGEKEKVEFMFNAILNRKINTSAICSVDGGPQYEVLLTGDSSLMTYKFSTNLIDFGNIPFNVWEIKEIIIENTGKVSYEFNVNISSIMRRGLIEIHPMTGNINGNDKQKLLVRLCPGIPDLIDEHFTIEIAHFEPEMIKIKGNGIYPAVMLQLKRSEGIELLEDDIMNSKELKSLISVNYPNDSSLELEGSPTEQEIENDRKTFCDLLLKRLNTPIHVTPAQSPIDSKNELDDYKRPSNRSNDEVGMNIFQRLAANASSNSKHLDPKCYDKMILATYQLDFGNIIIGSSKKKQFKLINVSSIPISLNFDYKTIKTMGITLSHEKSKTINIIMINLIK